MKHTCLTLLILGLFSVSGLVPIQAAEPSSMENRDKAPEEIRADFLRKVEEAKEMAGEDKVEPEEGIQMPEIPQAIKDDKLSPAESVRLSNLELKRAEGKMTQTEYDLEKDTLARDANIRY